MASCTRSVLCPDLQRRKKANRSAAGTATGGTEPLATSAISLDSSRCLATGKATGATLQRKSRDCTANFFVLSNARFIPSAKRWANTILFLRKPSLYLPAPMLPPAPLK